MNLPIPAAVRESARPFGDDGDRWLAALPGRVEELTDRWSLDVHEPFEGQGVCSWVAPATRADGTPAVLKITIPHTEARYEGEALRAFDGRGAARLLEGDGFALLLERCLPGTQLRTRPTDEGNAVAARLLRGLWQPPPPNAPFDLVDDVVADWCDRLPVVGPERGYGPDLVGAAISLGRELIGTGTESVLLHGDLNPGNVLAAEREPWLAIDPKPFVGDPVFDAAQLLINRADDTDDPAELRRQIGRVADGIGHDRQRVWAWTYVKAVGWNCGPERARLLGLAG